MFFEDKIDKYISVMETSTTTISLQTTITTGFALSVPSKAYIRYKIIKSLHIYAFIILYICST